MKIFNYKLQIAVREIYAIFLLLRYISVFFYQQMHLNSVGY